MLSAAASSAVTAYCPSSLFWPKSARAAFSPTIPTATACAASSGGCEGASASARSARSTIGSIWPGSPAWPLDWHIASYSAAYATGPGHASSGAAATTAKRGNSSSQPLNHSCKASLARRSACSIEARTARGHATAARTRCAASHATRLDCQDCSAASNCAAPNATAASARTAIATSSQSHEDAASPHSRTSLPRCCSAPAAAAGGAGGSCAACRAGCGCIGLLQRPRLRASRRAAAAAVVERPTGR